MNAVALWIETHPTIFALIVWPIVTAFLTTVFSKPSDAFAAKWPRVAAIRRIPSDAGINLPKLLANVLIAITGKPNTTPASTVTDDPPKGGGVPPLPLLVLFVFAALLSVSACSSASSPARDATRAAVELVTKAVTVADAVCASSNDAKALESCAKAYDVARPSLIAAAGVVDTWEHASANDRACALSSSLKALSSIQDAIKAAGVRIPDLVADALTFAGALAGECKAVAS